MRSTKQEMTYDGGDVRKWQRRFRRKLAELLGYDFNEKRVNLDVRSLWKKKHELGTIEKIVFARSYSTQLATARVFTSGISARRACARHARARPELRRGPADTVHCLNPLPATSKHRRE